MKLVGLGDSITEGYPFSKEDSWFNIVCKRLTVEYCNMGINGDLTAGMLYRVREALAVNPDVIIVLGGTNDAFHHLPLEVVQMNIEGIIQQIRNSSKAVSIILGLPIPIDDTYEESLLEQYRLWMKNYAIEENIPVIDFYAALVDPKTNAIKAEYDYDGCHPNKLGHNKMAEVAEVVIRMNKKI
ncbi:GDSL-type esterase/lipase family protein [Desulfuribacillus alkaliarsenatis]|uniref:GDSL-type esterase/lipase family protein n=1 Tax=Desulfuribacillus alkaliarsenatis TaxID=766136 RepID=UPI0015B4A12A|nr:GDSL-type esterase/lipase family protein [Desulfuribacillus alkaliarsenatis]